MSLPMKNMHGTNGMVLTMPKMHIILFYPQLFVSQILHEKVISKLLTTKQHWEKFINGKLHFFTLKKNWFPFTKRKCSIK